MTAVGSWWLMMAVLGVSALPISWRLLRHLPSRGYALARPLGMLLTGYVLWIGGMFGFLQPTRVTIAVCLLSVAMVSVYIARRDWKELVSFVRENGRMIVATELVFALAFAGWALVRAHNPEIAATEKPMEIAFLNAILRSERFPPIDPWMSGYGISYYYFGYLMVAMLTRLSGVASPVAFNLGKALLFALTASGTYGLLHDLIAVDRGKRPGRCLSNLLWPLLAPVFVLLIGNLEVVFEMLHTRGLGSAAFWRWLDINGLMEAPVSGGWIPRDNWWWWRASRVVNDRDLLGGHMEVIDEFPQFSFLLGDMHPHVLGLPFVVLCLGLALNLLLGAREWSLSVPIDENGTTRSARLWLQRLLQRGRVLWHQHRWDMALLGVCLGSLGFINTWDLPVYLLVMTFSFYTGQRFEERDDALWTTILFAAPLAVLCLVLYLPFFLTFQSQAGGVLPLVFNVTRLHQYLMMFGVFVFIVASLLAAQLWRDYQQSMRSRVWLRALGLDVLNTMLWLITGPLLAMAGAVVLLVVTKSGQDFMRGLLQNPAVQRLVGDAGALGLLRQAVLMRLRTPGVFLLLALLLSILWYLMQRMWRGGDGSARALSFVYTMAGMAFLMTFGTEFIYLRDTFGTRMNTIFKFYYQAWVLMGLAAAFGAYSMLRGRTGTAARWRTPVRLLWAGAFIVLCTAGMLYPVLAIPNKTGGFTGPATLDGLTFMSQSRPDEYAAIEWLNANEPGVAHIVEATGGSFSEYAPISAFTGLPTVLGWGGHELQWRGNYDEPGKRERDLETIYRAADPQEVVDLLDKYQVEYVCLGPLEMRRYGLQPDTRTRLGRFLDIAFEQGSMTVFRR